MSSDRGTLQRGSAAEWQQPTAPAGRRPPSAPRERRPVLAVLAIVLIAGGALTAAYLVNQNSKTVAAIEISRNVSAGQRFLPGAMQEVQVSPGSGVNYVPWNEANQVAQFYASAAIPAGTLLNGAMVVKSSAVVGRRYVVGLALKEGQLPNGLQVGDHINLYQDSDGQSGCPGAPGAALDSDAIVLAISAPSAESGSSAAEFVEIADTPADTGAITCSAANGILGIAIVPAGSSSSGGVTGPAGSGGTVPNRSANHSASPGGTQTTTPPANPNPGGSASTKAG
jgi:hypothetical protein